MTLAEQIERSAELKRELVEFGLHPRFDRERRHLLRGQFGKRLDDVGEDELVTAIDGFVLCHPLKGGTTVLERFVSHRSDLSEQDRELLLGWRDAVEGAFEVERFEGEAVIVENLIDELTYEVYSNMGPNVFAQLEPGGFFIGRIVPVESVWVVSGTFAYYPKSDRALLYATAGNSAMNHPQAVFRNPEKFTRARELLAAEHARFIEFFGADFVTIPGPSLTDRMREFYGYCQDQDQVAAAIDGPAATFEYPPDLTESEAVEVLHDDRDGLGLYDGFAPLAAVFADPGLLDRPAHRRRLRDYLDDDTVLPTLFDRLAAREPENTNAVFRKYLGRKEFDWKVDGEALMRRYKAAYFAAPRLPSMVPISTKLAPYATRG